MLVSSHMTKMSAAILRAEFVLQSKAIKLFEYTHAATPKAGTTVVK